MLKGVPGWPDICLIAPEPQGKTSLFSVYYEHVGGTLGTSTSARMCGLLHRVDEYADKYQ